MVGSSVMSIRSGVTAMQLFVERGDIGAVLEFECVLARIGDPVIGIAAAVLALVDMEPLLPPAAQRRHRDALDLFRPAVGKIHVDQHVAPHAFIEHAADDVRRITQAVSQNGGWPLRDL